MLFSGELRPMTHREYKMYRKPIRRSDGKWLTTDLFCGAFLMARGNEIIGIEPTNQTGRLAFVISPRKGFNDDLNAWDSNSAVEIRDFLDGVYWLKALMREGAIAP
jgi:hypothetical protein